MRNDKLRVITFNYLPSGYHFVTEWIKNNGHDHVLSVTTPGPLSRPTPAYIDIVKNAPRAKDVLVTTRLDTVAAPLIRTLKPDLILSFSFPYRITPEICAIPTFGAINLHPSVLPAYRGPNPMRQFYEGATHFGATAHWIAPEYDTGNLLSVQSAELPRIVTPEIMPQWGTMISDAIAEGAERAVDGDQGITQDDSLATYAAPYTEEEKWIDFNEPCHVIQRKVLALDISGGIARANIKGGEFRVKTAKKISGRHENIGSVIDKIEGGFIVGAADGIIRLHTQPLDFRRETLYPLRLKQFAA